MRELVQFWPSVVQIGCPPIQCFLRDRLRAERCDERIDRPLDQVLIHAASLVQLPKGGLHAMGQSPALGVREAVHVDAAEAVHETDVTGLRQERLAIDEAPQRKQRVDAARIAVVAQDAREPHHGTTSTSNRSCFPGSYRRRLPEDAMTMRSMSGSWLVAHSEKP